VSDAWGGAFASAWGVSWGSTESTIVGGGSRSWHPHVFKPGPQSRDEEELMLIIMAALHTLENR
jgi:hypothetical protein